MNDQQDPTDACAEVRLCLSAVHDGEALAALDLPLAESACAAHLTICPACTEFQAGLARVSDRLGAWRESAAVAPPAELRSRLIEAAAPRSSAALASRHLGRAAAVLLGFLGLHFALSNRMPTRTPAPSALELFAAAGHAQSTPPGHTPPEQALLLKLSSQTAEESR